MLKARPSWLMIGIGSDEIVTIPRARTWFRFWLSKPVLEHSARTAVAAIASLLTARLSRLPESYWAAITTLIVMQSALDTSLPIAGRRFAGTALGAGLGAGLTAWFGSSVLT